PMPEFQHNGSRFLRFAHSLHKGHHHTGSCTPRDVETGNRIAVPDGAVTPTLSPAYHRKKADTERPYITPFFKRGKPYVRFRPFPGPLIRRTIKACRAHPILQGQLVAIVDAHAPLLG